MTIPWDKECIVLEGSGSGQTRITWNGHGQTDTTATFTAAAANFVAKGIAFEVIRKTRKKYENKNEKSY